MPGVVKTILTTPTLLAVAKGTAERQWVRIELRLNQGADARIGIGDSGVTMTTGHFLRGGFAMNIRNTDLARPATQAIYGIVASGSANVTVFEGI